MFYKGYYNHLSEDEILHIIKREGFNPLKFYNDPHYEYYLHSHPETKLLAFLKGTMTLKIGTETYECHPGDKVIVPGNILHEAKAGAAGCEFFWAEKLI